MIEFSDGKAAYKTALEKCFIWKNIDCVLLLLEGINFENEMF